MTTPIDTTFQSLPAEAGVIPTEYADDVLEALFIEFSTSGTPYVLDTSKPLEIENVPPAKLNELNQQYGIDTTVVFRIPDVELNKHFRIWAEQVNQFGSEIEVAGFLCVPSFEFVEGDNYFVTVTTEGEPTEDALIEMFAELEDED
jgi:hypothetical protein